MFEIITQAALTEENLFSFNWYMFFCVCVGAVHERTAAVLIQQTCLFTHNKRVMSLSLSAIPIVHLTPAGWGRLF